MKTIMLLLAAAWLAILMFRTGSPAPAVSTTTHPALSGDALNNPVYTSPTNGLAAVTTREPTNRLPEMPAVTNWPVTNLPPITNSANTNLPPMTNPPPLQPPGDK
jgi:hypothetical protein